MASNPVSQVLSASTFGANATFDTLMIGSIPICYQNDVMFGSIPIGISFILMDQVLENNARVASVPEISDDESWTAFPQKGAHEEVATPSPQRWSPRRTTKIAGAIKPDNRSNYVTLPAETQAPRKVRRAYQNELVVRSSLPVSNPFAPLRLVKKNSPVACLKTLEEFPLKYQDQCSKGAAKKPSPDTRRSKPRTPVHERLAFPKVPVRERLEFPMQNYKGSGKSKVAIRERLGKAPLPRKEWRPEAKTNDAEPQTEMKAYNSHHKERRTTWQEKEPQAYARVCMIEVEEDAKGYAVVYAISDEEREITTTAGRGAKKGRPRANDKASSSHDEEPIVEDMDEGEKNNEEGERRSAPENDEASKLRKELEKRDRELLRFQREKEEETESLRTLCYFLKKKGLLDEYLNGEANSLPKKKRAAKDSSSEEEEEEKSVRKARTNRGKQKKVSYEDEAYGGVSQTGPEKSEITKQYIQDILNQQLLAAGAGHLVPTKKRTGRPYPKDYDQVPYPDGYMIPRFMLFDGIGKKEVTPDQHLAHFRNACRNTSNNEALLLRQFSQSLTGAAFEWYASLENDSIESWEDMMEAFRVKFAMVSHKITIADLAEEKLKRGESALEYINRWRAMNIRCQYQMPQEQAVELLLRNIPGWMQPHLAVANIHSYETLIKNVTRLEQIGSSMGTQSLGNRSDKDKGKWAASTNMVGSNKAFTSQGTWDNNKDKNNNGKDRNRKPTIKERMNRPYSFKQERTKTIFKQAMAAGLELPQCKCPEEEEKANDPNYCLYHRALGHPIEDCYVFKNWVENQIQSGKVNLHEDARQKPAPHTRSVNRTNTILTP